MDTDGLVQKLLSRYSIPRWKRLGWILSQAHVNREQYQYQAQTIYVHSVGFVGKYEFYTNHLSIYEKFIFSPRTAMQYLSCT